MVTYASVTKTPDAECKALLNQLALLSLRIPAGSGTSDVFAMTPGRSVPQPFLASNHHHLSRHPVSMSLLSSPPALTNVSLSAQTTSLEQAEQDWDDRHDLSPSTRSPCCRKRRRSNNLGSPRSTHSLEELHLSKRAHLRDLSNEPSAKDSPISPTPTHSAPTLLCPLLSVPIKPKILSTNNSSDTLTSDADDDECDVYEDQPNPAFHNPLTVYDDNANMPAYLLAECSSDSGSEEEEEDDDDLDERCVRGGLYRGQHRGAVLRMHRAMKANGMDADRHLGTVEEICGEYDYW